MKELHSTRRNLMLAVRDSDKTTHPQAEVVITASEPMSVMRDGVAIISRQLTDCRIVFSVDQAEAVVEHFTDLIKEMKALTPTEPPNGEE
jgi:hypothetical protein